MKPHVRDYLNCVVLTVCATVAGLIGMHWVIPAVCTFFAGFHLSDGLQKHVDFLDAEKKKLRGQG